MSIRRAGQGVLLWVLLCAALPAAADSQARIVRLSYLDGDVQIDRGSGAGFERAVLNLPLIQGAELATRDNGTVEVEFEDGSTLRLIPGTSVVFHQLGLRTSGQRVSRIELLEGTAYLEAQGKQDDFTILAGGQQVALPRPARFRISRRGSELKVAVFKGEVEVQAAQGSVRVKKDETFTLLLDDLSQYRLVKGVDAEPYDAWNQERDQYRLTYASTRHAGYDPLYNYGYSDLNYFGAFFQYASLGWLWRPYNVGSYWDPFADGAWMYYPGYGYMWVSAYPWGWMPYRYGSWVFVAGYGWCWQPGRYWNTWYGVPVIHRAPPGYVGPHPPAVVMTRPGVLPGTVVVGQGPMKSVRDEQFDRWTVEQRRQANPAAGKKVGVNPVPAPLPAAAVTPAAKSPAVTTPLPGPVSSVPMSRRADADAAPGLTKGPVKTLPAVVPAAPPPAALPPATPPAPQPAPMAIPPTPPPVTLPAPHPAPVAVPPPAATQTAPHGSSSTSSASSGQKSSTSSGGGSKSSSGSGSSRSSTSSSKSSTSDRK